jgi:hypothetical protein
MKLNPKKKNHKTFMLYQKIENTLELKVLVGTCILINLKTKKNTYHNLQMNIMLLTKFFLKKDMLKTKKKSRRN